MLRAGGECRNHCYSRRYMVLSYHSVPRNVSRCDNFQSVLSPLFKTRSSRGFQASGQSSSLFLRNRAAIPRNVRTTAIYILFVPQAVCPRVLESRYP
jgi:hypothetical protein